MDLVTIIIPYYKKKKYIKNTLNSIFKQTYYNYEIIIVYDDSNHDDLNNIRKIINNKKNIKIIINKKNLGAAKSRNKAIKKANGRYLAFIDSDDIWKKNKLLNQIHFMKQNKFFLTHTSYNIIGKKNELIQKRKAVYKLTHSKLISSCDIGLSTVIIDIKEIKKVQFPDLTTKEDYALWLSLSKKYSFYGLNEYLTNWRKLSNSLSSNSIQKFLDAFKVYYLYENLGILKSIFRTFILSINFLKKKYFQ